MSRAQALALVVIGFVVLIGGILVAISLLKGDDTDSIDPSTRSMPVSQAVA